jgi:sialate O-acetylesterase
MNSTSLVQILTLIAMSLFPIRTFADVKPNTLFTDGMVLQRDREVHLWGTADAGEKVAVAFRGQEVSTTADNGRWSLKINSGAAGGPFPLTISGKNTIALKDVRVGEVWLCGGQSNMWFPVAQRPGSKELLGTENPDIRLFTVPNNKSDSPQTEIPETHWLECGPATVGSFSAVAYYFGRDLQKDLKVPIGLIHSSYSGSGVGYWLAPDAPANNPGLDSIRTGNVKPVLHNAMIAPLVPFGIRGVIWYQGEADTGLPALYRSTFPALIRSWRAEFGQGDFPFLFVQIAPYKKIVTEPQESAWAELRDAQRFASLTVPNTAMVVITDWGHEMDIHVKPKKPVGERMALTARAVVYHEKISYCGPSYTSMKVEGVKIVLSFDHVEGGLETRSFVLENVRRKRRGDACEGRRSCRQIVAVAGVHHCWGRSAFRKCEGGDSRRQGGRIESASSCTRRRPIWVGGLSNRKSLQQGRIPGVAVSDG